VASYLKQPTLFLFLKFSSLQVLIYGNNIYDVATGIVYVNT
jgi:hypothetical protein